jgi:hypothetical protein
MEVCCGSALPAVLPSAPPGSRLARAKSERLNSHSRKNYGVKPLGRREPSEPWNEGLSLRRHHTKHRSETTL